MKVPRLVRRLLKILGLAALALALAVGSLWIYFHPSATRDLGHVYGHRNGKELALDIIRPASPNGIGIVVMVSGGWKSGHSGDFPNWFAAPLLRHGYTVFAVYHISQPASTVMEIAEDVNRAVRYIRHNAAEFRIDPIRLGVTGGSAGGHLSLLLATRGGPGPADSADPVDRESSAVQAVAIFFPVTDLLNLGTSTENAGDGGPPKSFVRGFGPDSTNIVVWKNIGRNLSPIYYINSNLPPILIYHGDADTLVPIDQSQRFQAEAQQQGQIVEIKIHHGGQHGWLTLPWDLRAFADWFDRYLRKP